MKLADITTEDITTLVGLLTELQKDELIGKQYTDDSFYNPIQDINDNWVISTEEMLYTTNPETMWVKDLDLIVYEPKQTEDGI
jgi:DNA-binding MltR family transcriptional regulator